ncbi:MAG TPA: GNAT family N-acetyltransferase [Dokdonella sp.]|uniref:GNAT family N-acetyltransferase n=1 Tax=Dokdonella sp. TaxID=2291710 RepID=UPI0025BD8D31|nr:GNAT family N-acetyltransferase [Dokdonella sp.]MBX3691835.1 N-acetyltransferase [Dokdonella sp.]MCW5567950.1 N-acetyltransferase [Dokdonella sp.]HNR92482.1 GNAT family N-acetyltransferase [Dokdonella sp.]
MSIEVNHDRAAQAFVASVDGHRCAIDYALSGKTMTITHTRVPEAVGGRGIAADLTRAALAAVRAEGWKVVPACSYVSSFIERHAEYADLLA